MRREWGTWWPTNIPVWAAVGSAIMLVIGVRVLPFEAVFRTPFIALLGNDPYAYLHVVRQGTSSGSLFGPVSDSSGLGEPLLVWVLTTVTQIVGGPADANLILALYPLVAAALTGLLVYMLATSITDDVRVGVTAVVVLAVTPIHVSRTALGFADHHAFDSLFVTLIATVFTWLLVRKKIENRYRWSAGVVLGVGIAAQTMAWRASPLLLLPAFISFVLVSVFIVRAREHAGSMRYILFGFGVGAAVAPLPFLIHGWGTDFVATVPVLLFVGGSVILGLVYSVQRIGGSWQLLLVAELSVVALGTGLLWLLTPGYFTTILDRFGEFVSYIGFHQTTGIGETTPITQAFGPILGFTIMLGFATFLGLPALLWGILVLWRRKRIGLIVPIVYTLWFLGLAFVQRRFAVHLAPFLAILAGIGFIGFVHWLNIVVTPIPIVGNSETVGTETIQPIERERLAILGAMGLVGTGFSGVISSQILSRLEIGDAAYNAAIWMREYAPARGLEYPENYVLAHWGRVRMYNHFVNGHSRSYGYARDTYEAFLTSRDPDEWYEEFSGRVGFIVTRTLGDVSPSFTQGLLHTRYGSGDQFIEGVRHYRALWESETGEVKVFGVVPGAEIRGQGNPGSELRISTVLQLHAKKEIHYERYVEVDTTGQFSLGVPYPGTYEIEGMAFEVPESAVQNGETLEVEVRQ